MRLTVDLPDDLAQRPTPGREALEALVIAGYRSDVLTEYEAALLLGFTSRFEFHAFLKDREISDHAYGVEDLTQDLETLKRLETHVGNR